MFGVTTCTPLPSHMSYIFETNSEAVVSMITAWSATVQGTARTRE